MDFEPKTDVERAIASAVTLLVIQRNEEPISADRFLAVCRRAPDYALKLIDYHNSTLRRAAGKSRKQIADIVRLVEWELRGPSQFINDYQHHGGEEADFILSRMISNREDFSREMLYSLLSHYKRDEQPIRQAAIVLLREHFDSLADRVVADPLGLSEDVESLKKSIRNYGFSEDLNAVLQKIDEQLQNTSDSFDQAAIMRNIRSFFEKLHESIGKELQAKKPNVGNGTPLNKCGQAIDYLERKHVTTQKIKDLGKCLYSILSDGGFGVHALSANRDYTRLCRNMVVEYAVTLFFELERRLAEPGDS